ncbi:MAG: P27 family phage terminase small subunit [Rhodobacteraceae bacterium]|nr:P27 family phage terminase small subunit [Paracoccaceae bacterium]
MKGRKPNNVTKLPFKGDMEGVAVPDPAPDMSEDAAKVWREIAPILIRQSRLLPQYRPMFRVWCEAFSDYLKFTYAVHTDGDYYTVKTRNGDQMKKHAAASLRQDAIANMSRVGALFGLSPVDDQRFEGGGQGDLLDQLKKALDGPV